jgi:hypothetical protein
MLIGYYLLRSIFLSALAGHLTASAYRAIYDSLSLADMCLQILVAGEIAVHILRGIGHRTPLRHATIAPLPAACLVAVAIAAMLPSRGVAPVGRASAVPLLLMILFFLWAEYVRSAGTVRRIAGGFAAYGIVAVGAQVIRNYAALHHIITVWRVAAYAPAGVYLAVVLFWLAAFAAYPKSITQQEAAHV